jgi:RNA polymerase sigma-70 factor, ECF subfamily
VTTAKHSPRRSTADSAGQSFERQAGPYRREIKLHCYRMMGSLHEAEDLVQETYLRAWRHFDSFQEGTSIRAWLYRIATNACLNALASRKSAKRWLPDRYGPATLQMPDGKPATEVEWLDPYPDADLTGIADSAPGPEMRYAAGESVKLAFVAAIQHLPPRQRAAILLCDVLGWAAGEAAALIGGSTASINSALQRARETLAEQHPEAGPHAAAAADQERRELLDRYLQAWEGLDVEKFAALLKEDATYTMPPLPQWYAGRHAIRTFFEWAWTLYDGFKMVPTLANRQPAFAAYSRSSPQAPWTAHSIHVLTLAEDAIASLTLFAKPEAPRLFTAFGLPLVLPNTPEAGAREHD